MAVYNYVHLQIPLFILSLNFEGICFCPLETPCTLINKWAICCNLLNKLGLKKLLLFKVRIDMQKLTLSIKLVKKNPTQKMALTI